MSRSLACIYTSLFFIYIPIKVYWSENKRSGFEKLAGNSGYNSNAAANGTSAGPQSDLDALLASTQRAAEEQQQASETQVGQQQPTFATKSAPFPVVATKSRATRRTRSQKAAANATTASSGGNFGDQTGTTTTTNADLLACLICGKNFVSFGKLKSHEKTHSKSRPFKCIDCGKTFTGEWNYFPGTIIIDLILFQCATR